MRCHAHHAAAAACCGGSKLLLPHTLVRGSPPASGLTTLVPTSLGRPLCHPRSPAPATSPQKLFKHMGLEEKQG